MTTGDTNGTSSSSSSSCWIAPTTLLGLLRVLCDHQQSLSCKIVVGNTEVGIEMRFKHAVYPSLVHPTEAITELYEFKVLDDDATVITIGACCSLSTVLDRCQELMSQNGHDDDDDAGKKGRRCVARTVRPLHDMLRWFASTQIRNMACLGGNLVTASPIADMNPMLTALGAVLVLTRLNNLLRWVFLRFEHVLPYRFHRYLLRWVF
jgi:xanthine dehydrogenase/oxidase